MKILDGCISNNNMIQNQSAEICDQNIVEFLSWKRNSNIEDADSYIRSAKESDAHYVINNHYLKENDEMLDNKLQNALQQYRSKLGSTSSSSTPTSSVDEFTACQNTEKRKQDLSTLNLSIRSDYKANSWCDLNIKEYSPRTHTAVSTDLSQISTHSKSRPKTVFFLDNHVTSFRHAMEKNCDVIENSSPKEDVGVVLTGYRTLEPEVYNYANGLPSVTISRIEDSVFAPICESSFNFNGLSASNSAFSCSDVSTPSGKSSKMSLTESENESVSSNVAKPPTSARSTGVLELIPNPNGDNKFHRQTKMRSMSTCDLSAYKTSTLPLNEPRRLKKAGSLRNVFSKTAKLFKRQGGGSKVSSPSHNTPESNETLYFDDQSQISESVIINNTTQQTETYYKSYEDLTFEQPPSTNEQSFKDKCAKSTNIYHGDIVREIGSVGGVVQIDGYDISLHVAANPNLQPARCSYCSNLRKTHSARVRVESVSNVRPSPRRRFSRPRIQSKSSEPQLRDHNCPGKNKTDGRIVLGLVDPHENLMQNTNSSVNENVKMSDSFCIAGPAARIEYRERNLFKQGAILQLSTNVDLKTGSEEVTGQAASLVGHFCKFSCLQSQYHEGPYYELPNCYRYGNTLQVSLDVKARPPLGGDASYNIFVVPIVKLLDSCFLNTSPLNGIERRFYHVGIYGPDRFSGDTKCCISVSGSGFTPTILQTDFNEKPLRLLDSYILTSHSRQGFHLNLTTKPLSGLQVILEHDDFLISENELATKPRINRSFVIKSLKQSRSPSIGHNTRNFLVIFTGVNDENRHVMSCKAPNFNRNESSIPELNSVTTYKLDYQHEWAVNKHGIKLKPSRYILGSDREVFSPLLGVALKSTSGKKGLPIRLKWMLHYTQGDYIPIVNKEPIVVSDKEWYIGYSRHSIGLVPRNLVHLFNATEFYNWPRVRVTVAKLVEAMVKPVQHLSFVYAHLWDEVISNVTNWPLFAVVVRFAETFACDVIGTETNHQNYSLSSFYLNKYKIYCEAGPQRKHFLVEMIRALLYLEEYDAVEKIIIDCCIATLASKVSTKWSSDVLSRILNPDKKELGSEINEDIVITHPYNKDIEESKLWMPAYSCLKNYCKSSGFDNITLCLKLFQVEQTLADISSENSLLIGCVALLYTVKTLRHYDTKL